jgi:nucleotide-binding universal stress UspA family protein
VKTLMVATDFSERSDRALRRATLLARQSGAAITLKHVVDDDQPERIVAVERMEAVRLLADLVQTVRQTDGIPCEAEVILADPFEGVVRAVAAKTPDLLVIGPHRRQVLRDIFVGTTAERVLRAVTCPILMANAPPVGLYRRALIATDFSETSAAAAQALLTLGICGGCSLVLLHVFEAPALDLAASPAISGVARQAYLEDARAEALHHLQVFARSAGVDAADLRLRRRQGSAAGEILSLADDEQADLIVVGTRSRSGAAKIFLGAPQRHAASAPCCAIWPRVPSGSVTTTEGAISQLDAAGADELLKEPVDAIA